MKKRKRSGPRPKYSKAQIKEARALVKRGYREIISVGNQNADWTISTIGEDSDIWQNAWLLTSRMRDHFRTNPIFTKYRELLWSNVFGSEGITLRMKIKETEDRIVYAPDEVRALRIYENRVNRLREWAAKRSGNEIEKYRAFKLADGMERSSTDAIIRGKAKITIGDPDIYANQLIERAWAKWQRPENCDVRGWRTYNILRQLRLINGVCDGDVFIRMIREPKVNAFGFSLQLIPAMWCDRFFNRSDPKGNTTTIMGIEHQMSTWGLGKPVAFYFIKRQPQDWQFSIPAAFNFTSEAFHQKIDANEIIHYARTTTAESTRPAPWAASTIPQARQLDQYVLSEVISAREAACKTGFYYSDVLPEGGAGQFEPPDPTTGISLQPMSPGEQRALKFGIKYQSVDPKHPSGNFETFRKGIGQSISAGMPGGDYNVLFNDLANINFSAGRLGRLDTNEMSKLIQRFDIDIAERRIFEAWLEMSLITGAIALPLAKFDKFNRPVFQGRRWAQVDEIKAVNAAALRVANKFSSRNKECAEEGIDFEETAFELAEEEQLLDSLGLSTETTTEGVKPPKVASDAADISDEGAGGEEGATAEPPGQGGTNKLSPGKKRVRTNGQNRLILAE